MVDLTGIVIYFGVMKGIAAKGWVGFNMNSAIENLCLNRSLSLL